MTERMSAQAKPTPTLPPEFGWELDSGELTVYLKPGEPRSEDERLDILHFGESWSAEAVEEAVYEWDREMLAFGEQFFALWRELFPNDALSGFGDEIGGRK